MELNHLKYFYFVAKYESFTAAAKSLRIAQPAVSKMVSNLEENMGYPLFDRVGRKVRLTKFGSDLYRRCETIFGQIAEIEAGLKRKPQQVSGPLTFGTTDAIATVLLPKALKSLLAKHPNILPAVMIGTATEMCAKLSSKKMDFSLLFHIPELPADLEIRRHYPVPFKLVISSKEANSKSVCSTFIGSREVDDISTKTYPTLKKLQLAHPNASIRISTNSLCAHKAMVLSGMGVSILPEVLVKEEIARGELMCLLPEEIFTFQMKLVCKRDEPFSELASRFVDCFEASLL